MSEQTVMAFVTWEMKQQQKQIYHEFAKIYLLPQLYVLFKAGVQNE